VWSIRLPSLPSGVSHLSSPLPFVDPAIHVAFVNGFMHAFDAGRAVVVGTSAQYGNHFGRGRPVVTAVGPRTIRALSAGEHGLRATTVTLRSGLFMDDFESTGN